MPLVDSNSMVPIAKIGRSVGLNGHVLLWPFNHDSENLKINAQFLVNSQNNIPSKTLTLQEVIEIKPKSWRVSFREITNREQAAPYVNALIGLPPKKLKKNSPNEFYVKDLIGLEVFDTNGQHLGTISAVDNLAEQNNLEIQLLNAFQGMKVVDVPMFDDFIKIISIENRKVTILPLSQIYNP